MSDIGKIKPLSQTIPIRPLNKDTAKKEKENKEKNKKEDDTSKQDVDGATEHINEFI
jgi:hypothetical protein